jgi:hypothetical protein
MTLVPGLFSRNKHFHMYADPEVKRARARAGLLRGVIRQLVSGEAHDAIVSRTHGGPCELRYRIAAVRLDRTVNLSELELSTVLYQSERLGSTVVKATDEDRAAIDRALNRLSLGLGSIETGSVRPPP